MGRRRRRRRRRRRSSPSRRLCRILLLGLVTTLLPVASLRWIDPPTSAFILRDRLERRWTGRSPPRQRWTRWERISPHMAVAVIAAEDQRFLSHRGFDLRELRAAVTAKLAGRPLRGASTLSQQLARNLFLWRERGWLRKGLEAYFTVALELCLDKRRILELYLNLAELGPGLYGVGAASERYFGRGPARLDPGEAALLAAVLPAPRRRLVEDPSPRLLRRQQWILGQMAFLRAAGYLTPLRLVPSALLSRGNCGFFPVSGSTAASPRGPRAGPPMTNPGLRSGA